MKMINFKHNLVKAALYLCFCLPSVLVVLMDKFGRFYARRESSKTILVFQMAHLGDLLLTIPFLRNLKRYFPDHNLVLCCGSWNADLARKIPDVDEVLIYDNPFYNRNYQIGFIAVLWETISFVANLRKRKFSLVLDLRGHINALFLLYLSNADRMIGFNFWAHGSLLDMSLPLDENKYEMKRIESLLHLLGKKPVDLVADINLTQAETEFASNLSNSFIIALLPGAPWVPRRWPAKNFAMLADWLCQGFQPKPPRLKIVIVGGTMDQDVIEEVVAHCKIPTPDVVICQGIGYLAAVLKKCRLLVCNDTGPLHLATILNVPTISLFGPGNYHRWAPTGKLFQVIRAKVSCSPCKQDAYSKTCAYPKVKCMDRISLSEVKSVVIRGLVTSEDLA